MKTRLEATDFIEQYNSDINCYFSLFALPLTSLDKCLLQTYETENFRTVAIFKIKYK